MFHFQELDWLIYFPCEGNKGKYYGYSVLFKERKGDKPKLRDNITLGAILERLEVDEHYPHTVGFFKSSCTDYVDAKPQYLEIRIVNNIDEFWFFLNSLNL